MLQASISWIVGDWLPLRYMGDALTKKPRLQALDGLRAYAAVSVIVFHAILLFDPDLIHLSLPKLLWSLSASDIWPKIWLATFNGAAAVELFFLISGCVLIRSLNAALASESSFLRIGTAFAVRRALRIYPALMVCVLVATAVQSDVFSWTDAAANMTLWDADVIEPSWTLQVEMLAIPLMLLIAILSQKWGVRSTLALLVYACIARKNHGLLVAPLLSQYGYLFVLGALVPTQLGATVAAAAKPFGWLPILVVFVYLRQVAPGAGLPTAAFGFALLALLYHDDDAASSPVLASTLPSFVGRVSFGLYLWNVPFLHGLSLVPRSVFPSDTVAAGLVASVVIIPLSVVLAAISYRFVEAPGMALGRKLSETMLKRARPGSAKPIDSLSFK